MQIFVGVRRVVQSGENPDVFFTPTNGEADIRQVSEEFCTKRESFSRTATMQGHRQCPPGYSLQPFRIAIVLPTLVTFTLRVGEKGGAGSSAPQPSTSQARENPAGKQRKTAEDCRYVADDEDLECAALRARAKDTQIKATQARQAREAPINYAEGDYQLLHRVAPVFPARALSRGIEGQVEVSFTIAAIGVVTDPVVVSSTSTLFNRAAIRAVLKYKYRPRVVDGQALEVPGVTETVVFKIDGG